MLYVAGFDKKNAPQLYVNADTFELAYKKVMEWTVENEFKLVCINDFQTDTPIEIDSTCYELDSKTNQLIPKDDLAIYGIRYLDNNEEKEKLIISSSMDSIVFGSKLDIRGLWRVIGINDKLII